MKRQFIFLLTLSFPFLVIVPALSQSPVGEKQGKSPDQKSATVLVQMLNGSTLRVQLDAQQLEVTTSFGKLKVPSQNIRSIQYGLRLDPAERKKIEKLVDDLGSPVPLDKVTAMTTLIDLGAKAYPIVKEATKSVDPDVAKRAKSIVKTIEGLAPKQLLERPSEDRIRTDKFTVVGTVTTPMLKAHAEMVGPVTLKPAEIYAMNWLGRPARLVGTIDARKFGRRGKWLDTKFFAHGYDTLTITAEGELDLWPNGPGQYKSNPEGRVDLANRPSFRFNAKMNQPGALVGKVGEDGFPFYIGTRRSITVRETGNLYLHIVPSPWNNPAKGEYKVTVSRGRAEK